MVSKISLSFLIFLITNQILSNHQVSKNKNKPTWKYKKKKKEYKSTTAIIKKKP